MFSICYNGCIKSQTTVALNHKQIKSHPARISNIKPVIYQYDWKEIKKIGMSLKKKIDK